MVKYENFQNEDDVAVIIDNEYPPATNVEFEPRVTLPPTLPTTQPDAGPQVIPNKSAIRLKFTLNHVEWCLFGCFAHGFAYNRLSKRFGITHGIYKFILPYCFAFIVLEYLYILTSPSAHEAFYFLKFLEFGSLAVLIYFYTEVWIKFVSRFKEQSSIASNYVCAFLMSAFCCPCLVGEMGARTDQLQKVEFDTI
jgi:hypothetical protein